jgi:RNA-directed DNA polymerase
MREIGVLNLPCTERWQTSSWSSTINQCKRTKPSVKDRFGDEIGTTAPIKDWAEINWKLVKKRVKNLRQRIYRATQSRQWKRVKSLMKLMLRSYSNLLLSIRRVAQENQGKQTPGVDGKIALTPGQRVSLTQTMLKYTLWKVQPVRRVQIPKANGKLRPLGIATLEDRVAQTIVKNALEPSWEARFESQSYGFRPGRSCHDAIEHCHTRLRKGGDIWVLDADIQGAFDNLNHSFILNAIGPVPGRALIQRWLQAGYVEAKMFHATEQGVPQGGPISPLLLNIALHGLATDLSHPQQVEAHQASPPAKQGQTKTRNVKYGYLRYADDFLLTARTKADIEAILPPLKQWLQERGLQLNEEKTHIVHVEQGFNYLGFTIRHFHGSCYCIPHKEKVITFVRQIRHWLKTHPNVSAEAVIRHLNPILRGWGNYYKHGASKRVFQYVDTQLWKALWRWALKRHRNKPKSWVAKKYFQTLNQRQWNFSATVPNRHGNLETIVLLRLAAIPIERHVKVKGTASPDDPNLSHYWQQRQTRYGQSYWQKGSKLYNVAENQHWHCPVCGDHLLNGEALQTHHRVAITEGGTDLVDNLIHLHQLCHWQQHRNQTRNCGRLEPDDGLTVKSGS